MNNETSISVLASLFTNMSHETMMEKLAKIPSRKTPIKTIENPTFIEDEEKNAQVNCQLITSSNGMKQGVISYQSTVTDEDWRTNMEWGLTKQTTDVEIHTGFLKYAQSVSDKVHQWIQAYKSDIRKLLFTGFSQGGAVAAVAAYLQNKSTHHSSIPISTYMQSSPRAGNRGFQNDLEKYCLYTEHQFVEQDPVPRLPPRNVIGRNYGQPANTFWVARENDKIPRGNGPNWCAMCCAWIRRKNQWNDHDIHLLIERLTGITGGEI